jgi:hypothetical protein
MPEMKTRLAVGHNGGLAPMENSDIPTLAGAGARRSTATSVPKSQQSGTILDRRNWSPSSASKTLADKRQVLVDIGKCLGLFNSYYSCAFAMEP